MNESEIVRRAQQGDTAAFSVLFEKYKDFVWNVVYRMVYDFNEAEDIAQDVFVTAWKKLGSFSADSAFSTWLYRITVNKTLNRLRARRNDHPLSDETVVAYLDTDLLRQQNPEALVAELEAERILALLLAGLDPDKRLAVILRELEGLSYEEIAGVTGVPLGTVKSRIARARNELMEMAARMEEKDYGHG